MCPLANEGNSMESAELACIVPYGGKANVVSSAGSAVDTIRSSRLLRSRRCRAWLVVVVVLGIGVSWLLYRALRPAEGIDPVHIVRDDPQLGEVYSASFKLWCFPDLQEAGISSEDIRVNVEARLSKAGLTIVPLSASCPELNLHVSIDRQVRKGMAPRTDACLKGYVMLCVSYPGGNCMFEGWAQRCHFTCSPRNLRQTLEEALSRVMDAFVNDYRESRTASRPSTQPSAVAPRPEHSG